MSAVQRWDVARLWADKSLSDTPHHDGEWVRYDDHVAALAKAVDAARWEWCKVEAMDLRREPHAGSCRIFYFERTCSCGAELDAYRRGQADAAKPRILTADDPEPAVGSVVLDRIGDPWRAFIGYGGSQVWASAGDIRSASWSRVHELVGPVRLLHDGGQA